jgi:hypothetical protein
VAELLRTIQVLEFGDRFPHRFVVDLLNIFFTPAASKRASS